MVQRQVGVPSLFLVSLAGSHLQTCHLLNYSAASQKQLAAYLRRTGWLAENQAVAYSEGRDPLVFMHLTDPGEYIPEPFWEVLGQYPAVIITSPYPAHLFSHIPLPPFAFLTEPFSFEQFAVCLEQYVSIYG